MFYHQVKSKSQRWCLVIHVLKVMLYCKLSAFSKLMFNFQFHWKQYTIDTQHKQYFCPPLYCTDIQDYNINCYGILLSLLLQSLITFVEEDGEKRQVYRYYITAVDHLYHIIWTFCNLLLPLLEPQSKRTVSQYFKLRETFFLYTTTNS